MVYFVEIYGELVVVDGEDPGVASVVLCDPSVDYWRLPLPAGGGSEGDEEVLSGGRCTAMDLLPMVSTLVTVSW